MQNVFLFTGENAFALRQERQRWQAEFTAKHGPENLLVLDGSQVSLRSILDDVSVLPFIAEKRLVIIHGLPKFTKEEMRVLLDAVHPACVLLFCDAAPDRRLSGTKEILASATVKQFAPLTGRSLVDWLESQCRQHGSALEGTASEMLLRIVGDDQEMLAQEVEKLSLFSRGTITADHVSTLAVPSGEREVWELTTLLSSSDRPGALAYARMLLKSGEEPFSLWNILLWLLRSLTAVTLCVSEGERNPAKIASLAGVPFPTAKMLLSLAKGMPVEELHRLISWAVRTDIDLKTGGYRATAESPQELLALIDDLIIRCCALKAAAPAR